MKKTVVVIGGGAAGFFGALTCATKHPNFHVIICEKTVQLLSKVRISGGGRCNVTHHCFSLPDLIQNYPRGGKELLSAFTRFQPRDTVQWFESRGVALKAEQDGRIFPVSDSSETIIACLLAEAAQLGVEIRTGAQVVECTKQGSQFTLSLASGEGLSCDFLLVAAGGNSRVRPWLEKMGHSFSSPVPSLFTFNIPNSFLLQLAGVSLPNVSLSLEATDGTAIYQQTGALLITHWGFSGPAVLKLSAWAARFLHEQQYRAILKVNWLPAFKEQEIQHMILDARQQHGGRLLTSYYPFDLPKNLWKAFLVACAIPSDLHWARLSKPQSANLLHTLHACRFEVNGKSTYKEEFVTCGGVRLHEVDFKTMQSRLQPGLYFAGEILDIDGVTGGFNFQSAWTTAWIAAHLGGFAP